MSAPSSLTNVVPAPGSDVGPIMAETLLKPPAADPWAWWQASVNGKPQPFDPLAPQTGFYRFRPRAADRGTPCAIWHSGSEWIALVDQDRASNIDHVWRWSHKQPITEDLYEAVIFGAPWPDEIATTIGTPEAGHNAGLPEEIALDTIAAADAAFAAWLESIGGTVRTEEQDQVAKGYDKRIVELRQEAETARKIEKEIHLRAGQAVDAKWKPVTSAASAAEGRISVAVTAYRKERKRLIDEAAAAERAERDRIKAEHAAAARAAEAQGKPVPPAPMVMTPRTSKPATGLRKTETVEIDDVVALATYLAHLGAPDVLDAMQRTALRMLKAGSVVPGARLVVDFKA